jgi:hypothetical protein
LKEINAYIENAHQQYNSYEWTWAWDQIQSHYGLSLETITPAAIMQIVEEWRDAVVSLDEMLYEDAKKEFSLNARTGFGADGDLNAQRLDFEEVRGNFEQNTFVKAILQHIEQKTHLGNKRISEMIKLK